MPKTVSARIENNMHQDLIEKCNRLGCRVSDYVKASIEITLYGEAQFDFGTSLDDEDEVESGEASKKSQPIRVQHQIGAIGNYDDNIPTARFH